VLDHSKLILKHNLFGLDIDDRAGQLAGFALPQPWRDLNLSGDSMQKSSAVTLLPYVRQAWIRVQMDPLFGLRYLRGLED